MPEYLATIEIQLNEPLSEQQKEKLLDTLRNTIDNLIENELSNHGYVGSMAVMNKVVC